MSHKVSYLLNILLIILVLLLLFKDEPQQEELSPQINALRQENSELKKRLSSTQNLSKETGSESVSTKEPSDVKASPQADSKQLPARSSREAHMGSRFALAGIERYLVLSEEQKEKTTELLKDAMQRAENGETNVKEFYEESLKNILGTEHYQNLKTAEQEDHIRRRQERIEKDVFSYSRKLGLNEEQENQMMRIMTETQNKYFPDEGGFRQGFMFTSPEERHKNMSNFFQARQTMNQEISTELQTVLSDQQYNTYLEIENSNSDNNFHPRN